MKKSTLFLLGFILVIILSTAFFLGQICSIPIRTNNPIELKEMLYEKYKIEIPVIQFENTVYLRISFQAYNGEPEIETLINALVDIQKKTSLLS